MKNNSKMMINIEIWPTFNREIPFPSLENNAGSEVRQETIIVSPCLSCEPATNPR